MIDQFIAAVLLRTAKLAHRALRRLAIRSMTANIYLYAAGVDVDRLERERP